MSVESYFQRFGFCERQIQTSPSPDLGLAVVVPCFNEPDVIGCLESLWRCERPGCAVEIILVINSSETSPSEVLAQNQATLAEARRWRGAHADARLAFEVLHFPALPRKRAGVGLARKIGMDEALYRFADVSRLDGVIACYDADCGCEQNYLTAVEGHFQRHPGTPGCSIYFEHALDGPLPRAVYEAVAAYELHLRYYVQALRYAAFPHAHHTVGSCLAIRAGVYQKQGGMNRRQAGEDFYFLQKVIPLGGFTDLTETTVYPSPRGSNRVPFGTGKAVQDHLHGAASSTYPLEAFLELKELFALLPELRGPTAGAARERLKSLPEAVRRFLESQDFEAALAEVRENTATDAAYRKRVFHWCDGFRVMKFIHYARDNYYGERPVEREALRLLDLVTKRDASIRAWATGDILAAYRRIERRGTWA